MKLQKRKQRDRKIIIVLAVLMVCFPIVVLIAKSDFRHEPDDIDRTRTRTGKKLGKTLGTRMERH